ncbi:hypothetical protein BKA70DRAFT_1559734, partial [Coprinopsis sp. MPI-PUGE-AT-0042]
MVSMLPMMLYTIIAVGADIVPTSSRTAIPPTLLDVADRNPDTLQIPTHPLTILPPNPANRTTHLPRTTEHVHPTIHSYSIRRITRSKRQGSHLWHLEDEHPSNHNDTTTSAAVQRPQRQIRNGICELG